MRGRAVVVCFCLAAACGGKTVSETERGRNAGADSGAVAREAGGTTAIDGGVSVVVPPVDAGVEVARACAHLAAVDYAICNQPGLPAAETARRLAILADDCIGRFTMPGNAATAHSLESCAAALEGDCVPPVIAPPECDFRGTLGEGAPCITSDQCASGACRPTASSLTPSCGHCAALLRVGDDCSAGGCPEGSVCLPPPPVAAARRCVARTVGAAGAPCDDGAAICRSGLACSGGRCTVPPAEGDACSNSANPPCRPPLYCGDTNRCTSPGVLAESCSGDWTCAPGFVCDSDAGRCVAVDWRKSGDTCDHRARRCLWGGCSEDARFMNGKCSTVVAEGGQCDQFELVCDVGLLCVDASCRSARAILCAP